MRWGLIAIALAACNGGQGVDIEVHPETKQFDAVELWISYDMCKLPDGTACTAIGWPSSGVRPEGDVYTVGDYPSGNYEKAYRLDSKAIVDGVARFHFDTPPGAETPNAIAVVGLMGTDVTGVEILSPVEIPTEDQRWRLDLHDVGDVEQDPTVAPADGHRYNALMWARERSSTLDIVAGYAGCLAYQKWNDTKVPAQWDTLYFVPQSDPDCDGDPPDCNPYWYKATVSNARCVDLGTATNDVCMVGALTCKAETADGTCTLDTQPRICVPSAVCASCRDSDDLGACLKAQVTADTNNQTPPAVPVQKCTMLASDTGPCLNNTLYQGWSTTFTIRTGTCGPKTTTGPSAVFRPLATPFTGNSTTMMLPGGAVPGSGGMISVHGGPEASGGGCTVDITLVQGTPAVGTIPILIAVFNGPNSEILVPVVLDFERPTGTTGCPTPTASSSPCMPFGSWPYQLQRGDSMFDCLGPN